MFFPPCFFVQMCTMHRRIFAALWQICIAYRFSLLIRSLSSTLIKQGTLSISETPCACWCLYCVSVLPQLNSILLCFKAYLLAIGIGCSAVQYWLSPSRETKPSDIPAPTESPREPCSIIRTVSDSKSHTSFAEIAGASSHMKAIPKHLQSSMILFFFAIL